MSSQRHERPGRGNGARDGISGLLGAERALRGREVSQPDQAQRERARTAAQQLRARAQGRR